jgi:hypothetical protein
MKPVVFELYLVFAKAGKHLGVRARAAVLHGGGGIFRPATQTPVEGTRSARWYCASNQGAFGRAQSLGFARPRIKLSSTDALPHRLPEAGQAEVNNGDGYGQELRRSQGVAEFVSLPTWRRGVTQKLRFSSSRNFAFPRKSAFFARVERNLLSCKQL